MAQVSPGRRTKQASSWLGTLSADAAANAHSEETNTRSNFWDRQISGRLTQPLQPDHFRRSAAPMAAEWRAVLRQPLLKTAYRS